MTLKEANLERFIQTCQTCALGVQSVDVVHETRGACRYAFVPDTRRNIYSGAKTITSLAIGCAIDEGRVALDTHLLDVFPERRERAAEGVEAITIRHLLTMTAGKAWPRVRHEPLDECRDLLDVFLEEGLSMAPGTAFRYNNVSTYVLGRVIEATSGMRLDHYLRPRLFAPLGFAPVTWSRCRHGHTLGYSDLWLTPQEFTAVGTLLLMRGRWAGRTLVPSAYIEAMTEDIVSTAGVFPEEETQYGYGYQVWRNSIPDSFRADGMYGQFLIVSPRHRALVAIMAHNDDDPYAIIAAVKRDILELLFGDDGA